MSEKPRVTRAGMGVIVRNPEGKILMGLRDTDAALADSDLHGEGI